MNRSLLSALIIGVIAAGIVMGLHQSGLLQSLETAIADLLAKAEAEVKTDPTMHVFMIYTNWNPQRQQQFVTSFTSIMDVTPFTAAEPAVFLFALALERLQFREAGIFQVRRLATETLRFLVIERTHVGFGDRSRRAQNAFQHGGG